MDPSTRTIRQALSDHVKHLTATDPGSIFSQQEAVRELLPGILTDTSPGQRERLASSYRKGEISRRRFLQLLGISALGATVTASGAGYLMGGRIFGPDTPTGRATDSDSPSFSRTVNAVDDLGMDPDGSQPIDGQFQGAIQNGTLIEFPPGDYLIQNGVADNSVSNFGIRGTGQQREDVRFTVPANSANETLHLRGSGNILIENISFDQKDGFNRAIQTDFGVSNGPLWLRKIALLGTEPADSEVPDATMFSQLVPTGGDIIIDDFRWEGPVHYEPYPGNRALFWIGRNRTGTVTFRQLYIENGAGSVIYGGKDEATMTIEHSFFANALDKIVRLSGKNDAVRNTVFINDHDNWHPDNTVEGNDRHSVRNIWWQNATKSGDSPKEGGTVENCDFIFRSIHPSWDRNRVAAIDINSHVGGPTITNCRFRNDTDNPMIGAASPSNYATQPALTIEDSHFTGSGTGPVAAISGRGGSIVRNCCIDMPNGGAINGARTENITFGGDCDTPRDQPPWCYGTDG